MKFLFLLISVALGAMLSSCSNVTVLRTKEINAASATVNKRIDSLMSVIDSLKFENARNMSRLKADFAELNSKINDQNDKSEARMEEVAFRLDRILGVVQQKSVVTKSSAGSEKNSGQEQKNQEMENLYNVSRSDYLRGEYVVAYNGFKQIYESLKTGELAENSLYWMGMCMLDANKKENAVTLFKSLLDKFPQGVKVCSVTFKLASMAEESGNTAEQKAYLQKILETKHCVPSNEFQRAADILQRN